MLAAEINPARLILAIIVLALVVTAILFIWAAAISYGRGLCGFYNDNTTLVIQRRGRWRPDLTVNPNHKHGTGLKGNFFFRFPLFTEVVGTVERRWDPVRVTDGSVTVAGFGFGYTVLGDYQIVDADVFIQTIDSDGVGDAETVQQRVRDSAMKLLRQLAHDRLSEAVMGVTDPTALDHRFLSTLGLDERVNEAALSRGIAYREVRIVDWTPSAQYGLFLAARELGQNINPS